MTTASDLLKCSFCGKAQNQVVKLIAGPGVYICDECVDLCNDIITEEVGGAPKAVLVTEIESAAGEAHQAIERLRVLAQQARRGADAEDTE